MGPPHGTPPSRDAVRAKAALRACALIAIGATGACAQIVGADFDDLHPRAGAPASDGGGAVAETGAEVGPDGAAGSGGAGAGGGGGAGGGAGTDASVDGSIDGPDADANDGDAKDTGPDGDGADADGSAGDAGPDGADTDAADGDAKEAGAGGDAADAEASSGDAGLDGPDASADGADAGDATDGASCEAGAKWCGGQCVAVSNPAYGCTTTGCTPCAVPHATASCTPDCSLSQCTAGWANCDGIAANGCEQDVSSDPNNCGACGKICAGWCSSSACADPVKIATNQDAPGGVLVDGGTLYWVTLGGGYGTGSVVSMPSSGGAVTVLATGLDYPTRIAVDAANVYFTCRTDQGSVRSVPKPATSDAGTDAGADGGTDAGADGGAGQGKVLASNQSYPRGIATDGVSVYFANDGGSYSNQGSIIRVPVGGGATTTLASSQPSPLEVAIDGAYLYFTNYDTGGGVMRVPKVGGATEVVAANEPGADGIAIRGGWVYFTINNTQGKGKVMRVPTMADAGAPEIVASGLTSPEPVAVDPAGTAVYFAEYPGVRRVVLAGPTLTALANGNYFADTVAIDATYVYWPDYNGDTIWRVKR